MEVCPNCPNRMYLTEKRLAIKPHPCECCKVKNVKRPFIPEAVDIGGVKYEVFVVTDRPLVQGPKRVYGGIDFEAPIINLDGNLVEGDRLELTFIHELVHGLIFDRELGDVLGDREEEFTLAFARGLYAFMKANNIWFEAPQEAKHPAPDPGEKRIAPFLGGHEIQGTQTAQIVQIGPDEYRERYRMTVDIAVKPELQLRPQLADALKLISYHITAGKNYIDPQTIEQDNGTTVTFSTKGLGAAE